MLREQYSLIDVFIQLYLFACLLLIVCVHVCCMHMCVHVETRGQWWVVSFISLQHASWRQRFSLNLELSNQVVWLVRIHLCPSSPGITESSFYLCTGCTATTSPLSLLPSTWIYFMFMCTFVSGQSRGLGRHPLIRLCCVRKKMEQRLHAKF